MKRKSIMMRKMKPETSTMIRRMKKRRNKKKLKKNLKHKNNKVHAIYNCPLVAFFFCYSKASKTAYCSF